ncbi:hypothetical protein CMK11_17360 [Candidatus Poribacteria bacterium]|nr:hypothetical protein [Candidatus Poribacteria bacterium]
MYARKVGERELTLTVSGMLWNRSLVMMDAETESLWSHLLGRAMRGPLLATELAIVPGEMMTWEGWLDAHPDTTVLSMSRTADNYGLDFYRDPERFVYAWMLGGRAFSTTVRSLLESPTLNLDLAGTPVVVTFNPESSGAAIFSRVVGEAEHVFLATGPDRMRDAETGTTWSSVTGVAVSGELEGSALTHMPGLMSYRAAWQLFHPDGRVLLPGDDVREGGG